MYLSIQYRTSFRYEQPARQSHNEVRAAPTSDDRQRLLSYRLVTTPAARAFSFVDYWGTLVDAFGVRLQHERLDIAVEAVVETRTLPDEDEEVPLSALDDPAHGDRYWELLQPSSHTRPDDEVVDLARTERQAATGCLDLVARLTERVHHRLEYRPGTTTVGESVAEVLAKGGGVCQDYAHLYVAAARSTGLPARYVSGYLYAARHDEGPEAEPVGGDDGGPVTVQTHAWVEVHVPTLGWRAVDPTNHRAVGEHHVKIGAGRDYDDVAPLRGVYTGGGEPTLSAKVDMRRLADPRLFGGPPSHLVQQ